MYIHIRVIVNSVPSPTLKILKVGLEMTEISEIGDKFSDSRGQLQGTMFLRFGYIICSSLKPGKNERSPFEPSSKKAKKTMTGGGYREVRMTPRSLATGSAIAGLRTPAAKKGGCATLNHKP